ncbi:MAG: tetratricopeptide repeat protein [Myxococcales bacterium]|nr:tetratricopeptide repeat protein [Myxococcales bacterium]
MSLSPHPPEPKPILHADAHATLRRRLEEGARRVVVWGPKGVGRTRFLHDLEHDLEHELAPRLTYVDAAGADEAREALVSWRGEGALVVAAPTRATLRADAFVELTPLGPHEAARWLGHLVRRDGLELPDARLAELAAHTCGLPAALERAADLLRLFSADALLERCVAARDALVTHARILEHPLFPAPAPIPLDDATRRAAALLLAAGEPVPHARLDEWLPRGLDALLALRDVGLLRRGDDVELLHGPARGLALHPAFGEELLEAAARLDQHAAAIAHDARRRWVLRGEEAALDEIAQHEARMRRALERALSDRSGPHERVVELALALQARAEIHVGPAPLPELERAFEAFGGTSPELAIERARARRLVGDMEVFEATLSALDPAPLPPRVAARWHAEHGQGLRFHRRLDEAADSLDRARALAAADGSELEAARFTIDLGGMRYWQQRFDEAIALYTRGRTIAAQLGAKRTEAIALSNLCLCHSFAGDEAAADRAGREAVTLFEAIGDVGALGATLGHLGILAYQYGRLEDAERFLSEAELRVTEYFEQHVYVRFNRTCVALAAGRLDEAQGLLDSLPALLAASPSPLVAMHLERLASDLFEARGRFAEANAALARGIELARQGGSADVEAQLAAQRSRVLARLGELDASEAAEGAAREALERVTREPLRAATELVLDHAAHLRSARSGDATGPTDRLAEALRPAWEGLGARSRVGVSAADAGGVREAALAYLADLDPPTRLAVEWAARDPDARAICLDPISERARLPGGAELDAATRRNAFRLLRLLAEAGDAGLERDALVEGVWPGERMRDDAASNRLHNALAQLRAAGLAPHLEREGTRYRLVGVPVKTSRQIGASQTSAGT